MEKELMEKYYPFMIRDLRRELISFGLTEEQSEKILNWTETLPSHILDGINNTEISIKHGIITIKPNN